MRKIIQITDCHLVPEGEFVFGIDPSARLAAAISDVNAHHADADLCVLSGDLADRGETAAYQVLRRLLGNLVMPCQLLPGNHDDRGNLLEVFPELPVDAAGFIQSTKATEAGLFVFLDTVEPGVHSGHYCPERCAWLSGVLDRAVGQPVYLFLHHPPFALELPHIDAYRMQDCDGFTKVVAGSAAIRHMFFGHVHRAVSGSWRRIPFSSLCSTVHQSSLDFDETRLSVFNHEPPAYAVIFLNPERTVVHFHNYLDHSPRIVCDPEAPIWTPNSRQPV